MIQLHSRYQLRIEKMNSTSLCFFFVFWVFIYILLLIMSHLGPSIYTIQFLNSSFSGCTDTLRQSGQPHNPKDTYPKLPYQKCQLAFSPSNFAISQSFILRMVFISNSPLSLPPLNLQLTELISNDEQNHVQNNYQQDVFLQNITNLIDSTGGVESFPALQLSSSQQLNESNWKIVANNKTLSLHFDCISKQANKKQFEGCFSQPILQENKEDIPSSYLFYIKMPKLTIDANATQAENKAEDLTSHNAKQLGITKILFQARSRNQKHDVEDLLRWSFSFVSAGILFYLIYSLKNFYSSQLLQIQKYTRALLVLLLLWNIPFETISQEFENVKALTELAFLTLVLFLVMEIDKMNSINNDQRTIVIIIKLVAIAILNLPQITRDITQKEQSYLDQEMIIQIQNVQTIFFLVQCLIGIVCGIRIIRNKNIEERFKFLCYFTIGIFGVLSYQQYNTLFVEEDYQSSYSFLSKLTILNIYIYVISFLYLPVENVTEEQQYDIHSGGQNQENQQQEEDEETAQEKRRQIFGDIYKDIDLNESQKDNLAIPPTKEDLKKKQIWEKIQKSLQDEDEEEDNDVKHNIHLDEDNDSDEEDEEEEEVAEAKVDNKPQKSNNMNTGSTSNTSQPGDSKLKPSQIQKDTILAFETQEITSRDLNGSFD